MKNHLRSDHIQKKSESRVPGSSPPTRPARDQRPPEEPPVDAALPDEHGPVNQGKTVPKKLGSTRQEGLQQEPVPHEPLFPICIKPGHEFEDAFASGVRDGETLLALHASGEVCSVREVERGRAQHLVDHGQEVLILLLLSPREVVHSAAVGKDIGLGELVHGVVGVGEVSKLTPPLDNHQVRTGHELDYADDAVELLGLGDAVDGDGEAVGDGDVSGDPVDDEKSARHARGRREEVGVRCVEQVQRRV